MSIRAGKHPRAKPPLVLGHEVSGTLAALGDPTPGTGLTEGDAVTVNPLISCGECWACRHGHRHVCYRLGLYGIDQPGGMAEYFRVPAQSVHRLPDGVPADKAALCEPLAVGFHAVAVGRPDPADRVLVMGAGPIGLVTALALRRAGVAQILVTDLCRYRLDLARRLGFAVCDVSRQPLALRVETWTDGEGADAVYEATGHASAIRELGEVARVRATIVIVSVHKDPPPVDLRAVNFKELRLLGSRCYRNHEFSAAVEALPAVPVELLVSHRLPLEEGPCGFQAMLDPEVSCKVLFAVP
jgi:threonine dehydrogenase-like Zn-dependent dehydrogenase